MDKTAKAVQLIKNKAYSKDAGELESLLGGTSELRAFAETGANNATKLQIAATICLMKRSELGGYSSEEYRSYKQGIEDVIGVFTGAVLELASKQTVAPKA